MLQKNCNSSAALLNNVQQEISSYTHDLRQRGIELQDLEKITPRCAKIRRTARRVAYKLTLHQGIREALKATPSDVIYTYLQKHLPEQIHAKYMLALVLLFVGDYRYILDFLE